MNTAERSRLMALVFALRMVLTGLALLAVSVLIFSLPLTADKEWESLSVLFSVFFLTVAIVLVFIRHPDPVGRLLLLTPLLVLVPFAGPGRSVAALLGAIFFLEAFRRYSEAASVVFLVCQLVTTLGGVILLSLSPGRVWIITLIGLCIVPPSLFALGCWKWQEQIKSTLTDFDVDQG